MGMDREEEPSICVSDGFRARIDRGFGSDQCFGKLGLVKDVSPDLSYSSGLLTKNECKVGSFVDVKIFTAMSFGDEEYATQLSNVTINWQRRLMMQRSQVTSLFGAAFGKRV